MIIDFSRDGDNDEQDGDEDGGNDYTELTVEELPNNVRHVLNTIKSCKLLVRYVKKVFELFVYI
jgi:hypothetical protein